MASTRGGHQRRIAAAGSGGLNEFRNVIVKLGKPMVEGSESTVVCPSQLRQISISDLPMTNDTGELDIGE